MLRPRGNNTLLTVSAKLHQKLNSQVKGLATYTSTHRAGEQAINGFTPQL